MRLNKLAKPLYTAYTALTSGLFLTGFPIFWLYTHLTGRHKRGLKERLGFVPHIISSGSRHRPRIWIHAASLGEVRVASPIISSLRRQVPACSVILSATTDHGRDLAYNTFSHIPVLYAPLDTIFSVKRALYSVQPRVMVFLETEIWPAWLVEAHRMGVKTALINGRISERSIGRYLKFRPFFTEILNHFDALSMIMGEDARRIQDMGADPLKIEINGNAKLAIPQVECYSLFNLRNFLFHSCDLKNIRWQVQVNRRTAGIDNDIAVF